MGHPELVQGTRNWYLVAQEGESVMRVLSGMRLGETASGSLSFETSSAQLKLDLADDGDLLVSAVAGYDLESAEGVRSRNQHLSRDRLVEIRLPHHVLKLTTRLTDMNASEETTRVRAVRSINNGAEREKGTEEVNAPKDGADTAVRKPFRGSSRRMLPDRIVPTDAPRVEPKPDSPAPKRSPTTQPPPPASAQLTPPPAPSKPPPVTPPKSPAQAVKPSAKPAAKQTAKPAAEPASKQIPKQTATPKPNPKRPPIQAQRRAEPVGRLVPSSASNRRVERTRHSDATRRRTNLVSVAAVIGLAVVVFTLLYPAPRDEPAPEAAQTVDVGRAVEETASVDGGSPGPDADALPSEVPFQPPAIDPVVVEKSEPAPQPIVVEIAESAPEPPAAEPSEPIPDPIVAEIFEPAPEPPAAEPVPGPVVAEPAEPISGPVAQVPVERSQTSQTTAAASVARTGFDEQAVDNRPQASVATELEQIQETTQALEEELARRDLMAAGLALELGRLVEPPQESAYTLYNRVLTRYPDSPEAKAGVQSVRQGLINRTLAQLAGNDLDSARRSLQAAEDAGVNPQLIADLRGEIEYRQQLTGEQ